MHLPERDAVLGRLIKALKPGGWLIDEEFDSLSLRANPELTHEKQCWALPLSCTA